MERRILRWTLLATVLLSVVWGASSFAKPSLIRRLSGIGAKSTPQVDLIQWQSDLKAAHREAAASGRPMLIVVGGPRCVHCRRLESETLADPLLSAAAWLRKNDKHSLNKRRHIARRPFPETQGRDHSGAKSTVSYVMPG